MKQAILTLNAGSSSLKFALFEAEETAVLRAAGQIEGLGTAPHLILRSGYGHVLEDRRLAQEVGRSPAGVVGEVPSLLLRHVPEASISAVGHRVVHGGSRYAAPVIVDDVVLDELKSLAPLAPLHQPHNTAGIMYARAAFPEAVQVACFDTSFHRTHPWIADTFALPRHYYDQGIRRYGFHGLSYEYVTRHLTDIVPAIARGRVVIAHLGAGASMCAIRDGRSVGSTMGFSALDGLPMGTRCGQIDPGVVLYLMEHEGLSAQAISDLLYKDSGLKGLSQLSGDMRVLEDAGTRDAEQAIDYFVYRIRRELGAMCAILGGIDALVFCGGIGENAWRVREKVCSGFQWLGLSLDGTANQNNHALVSAAESRVQIRVVRTDEEAMIGHHTLTILRSREMPAGRAECLLFQ